MLYHRFQRFNRDERGHAIVIGAIGMLAMAVAILTSVSIGNAVYQKVKLQDATDAQAYSMAAKTARVFNFLAYTNRTMVLHHCASMTAMAWLSHAYYIKEFIGTLCEIAENIPYIGAIFAAIKEFIDLVYEAISYIVPILLYVFTGLNAALHIAQVLVVSGMAAELAAVTGANGPGVMTDAKAKMNELQGFLASLANTYINIRNPEQLYSMIDGGFGAPTTQFQLYEQNDLQDAKYARYRMLMGNIANAERRKYTAGSEDMQPVFLTRVWSWSAPVPGMCLNMSKTATSSIRNYEDQSIKDRIDARDGLSLVLKAWCSWFGDGPTIFDFGFYFGGQADYNGGGMTWGGHVKVFGAGASIGPETDSGNLTWYGITGYYLANPGYKDPASNLFNQPAFAMVGSKDMKGTQQVFELKSNIVTGDGTFTKGVEGQDKGQLDLTWQGKAENSGSLTGFDNLTGGMMALSAARAVYHRPGKWQEAPNFFNPLWTAQLIPADSAGLAWAAAVEPAGIVLFRKGLSGPMFNY